MRVFKWLALAFVLLGLTSCGSSGSASSDAYVMPDVVGSQLDQARASIESAGFKKKFDVSGGGTFGIVDESNWTVCTQTPAPGLPIDGTPSLAVDRSCGTSSGNSNPSTTSSTQPAEVLTASTNSDLAKLLSVRDGCDPVVKDFASKFSGRSIEFDGNVANLSPHGDYKTRYDVLIYQGDFSSTSAAGPNFKFEDVNMADLNLTGANIPSLIYAGTNLRIVAKVLNFNANQCLLFLEPVTTSPR